MLLHMDMLAVLLLGVAAGTLGGVIGFGSSIVLMPVLVILFGPREAVPIMAVAALLANASRALVWWRQVDWRAFAAYSATGVTAAALGAEGLASDVTMLVGNGYVPGHAAFAIDLLRTHDGVRRLFEARVEHEAAG